MAKISSITFAEVAKICYELSGSGESVSFAAVYAALGNRGSGKVVNGFIQQWKKEVGEKLAMNFQRNLPGLPIDLVHLADQMLLKLWEAGLEAGEVGYQGAKEELERQRAEFAHERDQALSLAGQESEKARALQGELEVLNAVLSQTKVTLAQTQQDMKTAQIALEEKSAVLLDAREQLARAQAALDAERRAADAKVTALEEKHTAEISSLRVAAQGERNHLMRMTDELRTSSKLKQEELQMQLEAAKMQVDSYRQQANKARDEATSYRARAEAAEALIARMTAKKKKPAH